MVLVDLETETSYKQTTPTKLKAQKVQKQSAFLDGAF